MTEWIQDVAAWTCALAYRWQTLLTGIMALGAAYLTVRQMQPEPKEQRRRRLNACRAMLPADLSSICTYTRQCAHLAGEIILHIDQRKRDRPAIIEMPDLPERVLQNLQALIEQLDDQDVRSIYELLSSYQMQRARLEDELTTWCKPIVLGSHNISTKENFEDTLLEAVRLHMIATRIFAFARQKAAHIPPFTFSAEDLSNALLVLGSTTLYRVEMEPDRVAK